MASVGQLKLNVDRFTVETKPLFQAHLEVVEQKILGTLKSWRLLEDVESTKDKEDYPSLRSPGMLQAYDEGNVPYDTFGSDTQSVVNRLFGRGLATSRNQWADFGNNKLWLAALRKKINALATRAVNHWNKLLADLILADGDFASSQDRYAQAVFATTHNTGSNLVNAAAGAAQTYTTTDIETEHDLVQDLFTAQTDQDSSDILREEEPNRLLILCDPRYARMYRTVYHSSLIPFVRTGTAATDTGGVGAQGNVLAGQGLTAKGERKGDLDVLVIGWARLRGKSKTIYCDASGDIGGVAPVVHQVREAPVLEHDGEGSSNYFANEELRWKVRMRGELFLAESATKLVEVLKDGN